MSKLIKVKAQVDFKVDVECPHCKEAINLIDDGHNDDGAISDIFFSNSSKAWVDVGFEICCKHCDQEFILDELEY